ncbi:cardiolipin synthase [Bacillus sp. AFS076308]|uniref:cardiolipin synthase n=1 Tax=unclassified Bacillus (in: firmicutes) TaxID=185979 RepID=UPI000BF6E7DE|nr:MULTISPECIES: cardiolipin synthase [unclassified Bacillus (in: firmicutes)]PFO07925.1 cardiolipin synthase [Bacillus sp. AFS076308]PGV49497.1 cardiolipin synthase [Bacillus sp. AFS037270]
MKFVLILSGLLVLIIIWLVLDFRLGRRKHHLITSKIETGILHGELDIFTHGKAFFRRYFSELQKAQKHIHILYYIVKNDSLGREFFTILKEKARDGVEVRLLIDRLGSFTIKKKEIKELMDAGVLVAFSNRVKLPFLFYSAQVRNHRKISIIDGKVGFMGGFNIGKEYIDEDPKLSPWRDYQLIITGESVNFLQSEFLLDWNKYSSKKVQNEPSYFPKLPKGSIRHQFNPTEAGLLEGIFIDLIKKADKSIIIGTPYFIPSASIFKELLAGRQRGVSITLIVPYTADHILVQEASYRFLRKLLKEGALVYQYQNGFYHAKTILIDDKICDIGSANFDKRSLFLNKEINCYIYDPAFIERVRQVIKKDILDSIPLSLEDLNKPDLWRSVKETFARAISNFL